MRKFISALLVLCCAYSTNAYFILNCELVALERLDPIVQPGVVSTHVHATMGGSGFASVYSYEAARAAKCTTCVISIDRSNYWVPDVSRIFIFLCYLHLRASIKGPTGLLLMLFSCIGTTLRVILHIITLMLVREYTTCSVVATRNK